MLAHELVHIKRHDTVLAGVAVVATVPWAVVRGTPAGVRTVHRLIGRGREFSADQRAAAVVRYPPGIGSALETMVGSPTPGRTDGHRRRVGSPPSPGGSGSTRWPGRPSGESSDGNLDDTRVRAAALSLD